jgi:hypothetical protein
MCSESYTPCTWSLAGIMCTVPLITTVRAQPGPAAGTAAPADLAPAAATAWSGPGSDWAQVADPGVTLSPGPEEDRDGRRPNTGTTRVWGSEQSVNITEPPGPPPRAAASPHCLPRSSVVSFGSRRRGAWRGGGRRRPARVPPSDFKMSAITMTMLQ